MWDSPIKQIADEVTMAMEGEVMRAVYRYGFDVDKEELTKALAYDRGQYDKGYADASREFAKELIAELQTEICERVKWTGMPDVKCDVYAEVIKIVERLADMKGEYYVWRL